MKDFRTYPDLDKLPAALLQWLAPAPIDPPGAPRGSGSELQAGGADQGTGAVYGTDGSSLPSLGPLGSFGSWPSVASTIMTAVRNLAFFVPSSTSYYAEPWFWLPLKFRLCPFWAANFHHDARSVNISKLSLKPALDAVVEFLRDLGTPSLLNETVNSIKKIAELAVQNRGSTQKDNHQQLGVITVRNSKVYIACFMISMSMEYKSGKGYEQLNQMISMSRSYGILDFELCVSWAALIEFMDRAPIDQWGRDISSGAYQPNRSPAWSI